MITRVTLLALLGLLFLSAPALAEVTPEGEGAKPEEATPGLTLLESRATAFLGAMIGVGLVVMGGAGAISRIGASAAEAMARQPEAAGSINGAAVILAAMIEGATLFAVVVCLLGIILGRSI